MVLGKKAAWVAGGVALVANLLLWLAIPLTVRFFTRAKATRDLRLYGRAAHQPKRGNRFALEGQGAQRLPVTTSRRPRGGLRGKVLLRARTAARR
jgi:hypothetical protein